MSDVEVTITPLENGPYLVKGPVTVVDADGAEYHVERATIALCRCGRRRPSRSVTARIPRSASPPPNAPFENPVTNSRHSEH